MKDFERFEYFQPKLNSDFVGGVIKKIKPDIVFLQEFYEEKDSKSIDILNNYQFKYPLDMWYGKGRALILSKYELKKVKTEKSDCHHFLFDDINIIPVHLNAYSSNRRIKEFSKIIEIFDHEKDKIILMGDFNVWNRKSFYIFKKDFLLMIIIKKILKEVSKKILSTTYLGFSLDKVFVSNVSVVEGSVKSPKERGLYMDHYPIYFDLER